MYDCIHSTTFGLPHASSSGTSRSCLRKSIASETSCQLFFSLPIPCWCPISKESTHSTAVFETQQIAYSTGCTDDCGSSSGEKPKPRWRARDDTLHGQHSIS
eukprot:COSAG04_NODE_1168_length_7978_cov_4.222998_6_plen_102_part_00